MVDWGKVFYLLISETAGYLGLTGEESADNNQLQSRLPTAGIVGIAVAASVVVLVVGLLTYRAISRRRETAQRNQPQNRGATPWLGANRLFGGFHVISSKLSPATVTVPECHENHGADNSSVYSIDTMSSADAWAIIFLVNMLWWIRNGPASNRCRPIPDPILRSKQSTKWTPLSIPFDKHLNTLGPRQNGRYFLDNIFTWIFVNENEWISIKISLKFVPRGPINNVPALVQILAWRRQCDKPLSEPIMVDWMTHIRVTRPQWVNNTCCIS